MPNLPKAPKGWVLEEPESEWLARQYPTLWKDPFINCITCRDKHVFQWWNDARTDVVGWQCDCIGQWLMHRYMLAHGIGKNYQRLAWADADAIPSGTQFEILSYLDNSEVYVDRGVNLILHSPDSGTGKTLSLMLAAKKLLSQGHDVLVAQMNSIVEMYTSGWRDKADKDRFERRIMNCAVLVVDDLGKEAGENHIDFIDRLLDRVIRHRTASSLPTLASTNLTPEQLTDGYGRYVASLLTETALFVETAGTDFRERARLRTQDEIVRGLSRPLVIS